MDRIYVMELVRSFQIGLLTRRDFLTKASLAMGSTVAANALLAACGPAPTPTPPVVLEAATTATAEAPTSGEGIPAPRAGSAQPTDGPSRGESAPVTGQVAYPGPGDQVLAGYLARQEGAGPLPAVVVIQEWWGVNEHIKDVTRRLAEEGFVALAPDLYHGAVVSEPDEARKLVMELDMAKAVREIRAAIGFLLSQEYVAGPTAGIIGFCMGGRLALATARVEERLGAAVAFYGSPLVPDAAREMKAPLLGLYGAEDGGIPVVSVRAMEEALDDAGIENQIRIYEGAGHAFFNDTRASFHADAAADAWQRTLGWLRQHLTSLPPGA